MGADLRAAPSGALPVSLIGSEPVSGLADMLHQFIEQTLADSPRKVRQAQRLAGRAIFRSAEDEQICVRITFAGDRIELLDGGTAAAADALITADFLTIAHLTAGRHSPFRLLAQRKLKVRFGVLQLPFLLGMLRFMQIESASRRLAWLRWAGPTVAVAAVAGAFYWYVATRP